MFKSITLLIATVALFAGTFTAPAEARIRGSIGFYSRGGFGIVIPLGRQSCRPPNIYPGYGNYGHPGYGNYGYPGYGNYGYPGYGNYGYPGYGNYGYPGYGNYGYPDYGIPGYRNRGRQFRDQSRRNRQRGHVHDRGYRRRGCR